MVEVTCAAAIRPGIGAQLAREVIRQDERRVAERLGLSGEVAPLGERGPTATDPKAEWSVVHDVVRERYCER